MLRKLHSDDPAGRQNCRVFSRALDANFVRVARDVVNLAGRSDIVEVVPGPAADSLRKLKQEGRLTKTAVLFIDHWEKYYVADLKMCEELGLFQLGSVVIADNTDMPGAPDYLEYVQKGASGEEGSVKYESKTYKTTTQKRVPNVLKVSTVVERIRLSVTIVLFLT